MQQIIQGNDTTVSVILYQQTLHLSGKTDDIQVESNKVDLSQVRELSVRLIPYMRWQEITPDFEARGHVIEVSFPASQQRAGKWDVEISYLAPAPGGSYKRVRVRQAFAEVLPANTPASTLSAYVISAEVTQALRGAPGKSAYQEYLDTTTDTPKLSLQEWLVSQQGAPGKSAYDLAVEAGFRGSLSEWLASQKGDVGKSAYQHYLDTTSDTPKLSLQEWLASLTGQAGKSAYQEYLDTTSDDPKLSLEEWLASNKGETGDSAYQSYLKTTTDSPKLTEKQWAKVNDYHAQILHAIIYGSQSMTKEYTGAELYDLSKQLRALNRLLQSRGVGVTEESPLVDLIKSVELAPSFPTAVPVYKDQQFDSFPNSSIPPVEFAQSYNKAYYTFWKSKLQTLPPLLGVDKITSAEGMCDSSDVLGVAKVGEAVSLTRMDRMFYGCVSLSVVHISTSPALVNMDMAFNNCGALTSVVGVIDVSNVTRSNNAFSGCVSLVDIKLKGLSNAIDLNNCRELSAESLRYLVDNAQRVTAKTITLSSRLSSRSELKETLEYVGAKAVEKGFSVIYR